MTERTLSILKPDATRRNLTGKINAVFEENGLRIVAQKRMKLSHRSGRGVLRRPQGTRLLPRSRHLHDLWPRRRPGPRRPDAIAQNRKLMGATNPANADEGTIRKLFAESIEANSAHGSDSPEAAAQEIAFFFSGTEIVG